jgi:hypothetical protein
MGIGKRVRVLVEWNPVGDWWAAKMVGVGGMDRGGGVGISG